MAPSVETAPLPTLNPAFREPPTGPVEYNVFATGPEAYKPEVEEKGTETQPPAKYANYLPTWDAEKSMNTFQIL
jgi:sulfonate dioxygenase